MRRLIQAQKLKLPAVTSRKRIDDADAALLSKLTQSAQQVVRHCDRQLSRNLQRFSRFGWV
jgi:hypothetical protein